MVNSILYQWAAEHNVLPSNIKEIEVKYRDNIMCTIYFKALNEVFKIKALKEGSNWKITNLS